MTEEISKENKETVEERAVKSKGGRKMNLWMISTIVLGALVLTLLVFNGGLTGFATSGIGKDAAGKKIVDFFNTYQGLDTEVISVDEEAGLYAVTIAAGENQGTFYLTKDGSMMGSMTNLKEIEQQSSPTQTKEIPKADKPVIDLYVMAFCPYGVQAENAMKPVYDLLKDSAEFNVKFIASVGGDTVESVQSLHGINEAKEDLRQVCIAKYYPKLYWNYVSEINANCYPKSSDAAALETCWKAAATKYDIPTSKIETCAYGSEGLALLKTDESLSDKYGISGSPTLMINGVNYNGGRDAESYKQAVCSAFNNAPAACEQVLSSTAATASGSC